MRKQPHGMMLIVLALFSLSLGCTARDSGTPTGSGAEHAGQVTQFVVWLPSNDPLVTEHTQWHLGGCGNPGARACPFSGEEFLIFHRNYLHRLRKKFVSLGRTEDITPWYSLPPEMKNPNNGWTSSLADAEWNIFNNHNPATGFPFGSLESYGAYIEQNYHNYLHAIAAHAYGENAIGPVNMSPTSTYFFKIHGLVEYLFQRFQHNDFNHDGASDMIERNANDPGDTYLAFMGGTFWYQSQLLANVGWDACQWQPVAVADMNFDGENDIIWRGVGCGGISIWYLNASGQFIGGVDSWSGLPFVGDDWKIVGTGDFNKDLQPDIVWESDNAREVSIWFMDADCTGKTCTPQYTGAHTELGGLTNEEIDVLGVADFNNDGFSDIMMRAGTPDNWDREINYFFWDQIDSTDRRNDGFDASKVPVAMGHYADASKYLFNADIVWAPPANGGDWYFSSYDGFYYNDTVNEEVNQMAPYYFSGPH